MKRVSANICYTHSTEESKMLISFDFNNKNIGLNCDRSMSTAIRDADNVNHTFDLTKIYCYTSFLSYGRTSCDYIGDVTS